MLPERSATTSARAVSTSAVVRASAMVIVSRGWGSRRSSGRVSDRGPSERSRIQASPFCVLNRRPRLDRNGRSRLPLYDKTVTDAEREAALASPKERLRKQQLTAHTLAARADPVMRALLDDAFTRLEFDDPERHFRNAIACYPLDAVVEALRPHHDELDTCLAERVQDVHEVLVVLGSIVHLSLVRCAPACSNAHTRGAAAPSSPRRRASRARACGCAAPPTLVAPAWRRLGRPGSSPLRPNLCDVEHALPYCGSRSPAYQVLEGPSAKTAQHGAVSILRRCCRRAGNEGCTCWNDSIEGVPRPRQRCAVFSNDGTRVFILDGDFDGALWTTEGELLGRIPTFFDREVLLPPSLPDRLITRGEPCEIWDSQTGKKIRTLPTEGKCTVIAQTPSGSHAALLFLGTERERLEVWTPSGPTGTLETHGERVWQLLYSNRRLVVVGVRTIDILGP